jgi:dienelactone hydrolase
MPTARRLLLTLALSAASAAAAPAPPLLVRDGLPHPDPQIASELPRFLTAHTAHFLDWLGDGSMLVRSAQGEGARIERLRGALAEPQAIGPATEASWSAIVARPYTSDAFVYAAPAPGATGGDANGAAALQLSLQQIGAGVRALGPTGPEAGPPAWAHDGKQLAFIGSDSGVYVIDTADAAASAREVVAAGSSRWRVLGWSIDDQTLLLGREAVEESEGGSDGSLELYLAAVRDGALQPVPPPGARGRPHRVANGSEPFHPGSAALASAARFASDGRALLLLTRGPCERHEREAGSHFLHLCYTDPAAGEWHAVTATVPHDVELFDASPDGSYIAYTLNDEGVSRLMLHDLRLQLDRPVDALAPGVVTALRFDPSGKLLALGHEAPGSAPEVEVLDLRSQSLARWTRSDAAAPDGAQISPQLVHFPTWDEVGGEPRQLSALVFSPGVATEAAPRRPVVILPCSGSRPCRAGYDPFVQYLVQRLGFAVVAADVRDVTGALARDDAVRDLGALLVWIGLQPELDSGRVAILGEGPTGPLALATLAQFGDRLNGAVAAFPARLGPLPNALAIRRPVLLVQGLADSEVPAYQIAQLREALRAAGVTVQYLAAADEGQRFARATNREAYYETAATFLAHLLH